MSLPKWDHTYQRDGDKKRGQGYNNKDESIKMTERERNIRGEGEKDYESQMRAEDCAIKEDRMGDQQRREVEGKKCEERTKQRRGRRLQTEQSEKNKGDEK